MTEPRASSASSILRRESRPGGGTVSPEENGSPPTTSAEPPAPPDDQVVINTAPAPTDDTPTVISRNSPQATRTEDILAGNLRGRRLAHFELLEPIGVGGMAAVLRARDSQLDRTVALKILPPEMATDQENIRRFHQEARAAAKLDHENIARVFYCGEDQKLHFIAFEFVEGENLRTLIDRRGHLPVADAISYMLQVTTGLAHASQRGVVHRDIKPSNIIITPTGRAKLVDMGLARSMERTADHSLTQSGVTLGTFDYISPEQALEPREADVRSDIYSLGCTFYHVLTGQPPAPEGTAAKKLQWHQHVAPVDPRQLNPEIPDEVAAILGRMMAKEPRDRYQRPEHLAQHLLHVARKLGVAAEVPEGLLLMDAPLPEPPRIRPVSLAVLAVVLLVALVLILGRPPSPTPGQETSVAADNNPHATPNGPTIPTGPPVPPTPREGQAAIGGPPSRRGPVRFESADPTGRDLLEFLQQNQGAEELEIVLAADLKLPIAGTRVDAATPLGLTVQAGKVTIRARDPGVRPTIWLEYDGRPMTDGLTAAALSIDAQSDVTVRGVRFVVDARASNTRLAGLLLRGGRNFRVEGCEFYQALPLESAVLDSLVFRPARADASLTVEECYFAGGWKGIQRRGDDASSMEIESLLGAERGGQTAFALQGGGLVEFSQCAFAPHMALFRVDGQGRRENVELSLRSCSAMLGANSTGFLLDRVNSCRLTVKQSLFSGPPAAESVRENEDEGAVFIRQVGETGLLYYAGLDNRYHAIRTYWWQQDKTLQADDWATFLRRVKTWNGQDDLSQPLTENPWASDQPLFFLEDNQPAKAFLLNVTIPGTRQGPDGSGKRVVGVERCVWGRSAYPDTLPTIQREPTPVVRAEKVVDPRGTNGPGVYRTLALAVLDSEPGDVILIRHTGEMPVDTVRIEKPDADLTIRPFPGNRPVLSLGTSTEADASLFRLHDGKLTLEGLQFRLRPAQAGFKALSVVMLVGEGQCTVRDCVATLTSREDPSEAGLALLTLADLPGVMRMDGAAGRTPSRPAMQITNCFVRGDGDLAVVRSGRPFDLDVSNSLVCVRGSVLEMRLDGGREDLMGMAPAATLRLKDVTAYTEDAMLVLQSARDARSILPLQVRSSDGLYVAAGVKPLVLIEGLDVAESQLRQVVNWDGRGNRYGNVMRLLEVQSADGMMMGGALSFNAERWKTAFTDTDLQMLRGTFFEPTEMEMPLSRALPAHFQTEFSRFGAKLGSLPRMSEQAE